MTVASRLRGALAVYVISLIGLAVFHAHAIQRAAEGDRALAETAGRINAANDRVARLDLMSSDAEKYRVTHDPRYRDRSTAAARELGLATLQPQAIDSTRQRAQATVTAAQESMNRQLVESRSVAKQAALISWLVAGGALVLGMFLSAALVRSIMGPLGRLATGTREVAAGRFMNRLDTGAGDEFSLVARDFNAMTERLAALDRMKKDFVARVSHDLKTPLSSMQETNAALLDEVAGPLSKTQRRLIELNLESGERLSGMLGKLLELSRVEAGMQPEFRMVDVSQIAKRSVESATASAARHGVRLSVAASGPSLAFGDASGIAQVLDNLVENAIKFSPVDGEVQVSVVNESPNGQLALTVADEGPGIPAAERERVFERFYQADAGRSARGRGVGLGLTICREIVGAHGGRIWIDDNQPRGSVFHVLLRRSIAAAAVFMLFASAACAPFHHSPAAPRPEDLQLRIASLTAELDAVRARLDSTSARADSLRLELERLKEIDLRPAGRRP